MLPSLQYQNIPFILTYIILGQCTDTSHIDLAVRSWSVFRESRTSRSSYKAEIKPADEATRVTQHLRHVLSDLEMHNTNIPTPVFNDNQGCIYWSKSTSINNLRHFNIRENAVREAVSNVYLCQFICMYIAYFISYICKLLYWGGEDGWRTVDHPETHIRHPSPPGPIYTPPVSVSRHVPNYYYRRVTCIVS
jgi:hypothetical protein